MSAAEEHPLAEASRAALQRIWQGARLNWATTTGAVIVIIAIGAAIFAPLIAPYDPVEIAIENKLLPPSAEFWLGPDHGGRDILSRVIWGSRASLTVSLLAVVIGVTGGILIGRFAAYPSGSWGEAVEMG